MVFPATNCPQWPHFSHAASEWAGGRTGATTNCAAAAAPELTRCALLNCNRLWSAEGDLRSDFYGWVDALLNLGVHVVLLTEPWVPQGASLPSDQPYEFVCSSPPVGSGIPGRDAAILCEANGSACCMSLGQGVHNSRDIVGCLLSHGAGLPPTIICTAYAPDASRGLNARSDFWMCLYGSLSR